MNAKKICRASEKDELVVSVAADRHIQETYNIDILKQTQPELTKTVCLLAKDKYLASRRLPDGELEIMLKREKQNSVGDEMVLLKTPSYFHSFSSDQVAYVENSV